MRHISRKESAAVRTAVLLINTGSPDAPEAGSVRRYLEEFLSDPRVIELPRWKWMPILHGIILCVRPAKSAARYRLVWREDGSPLIVHTKRTAERLAERFDDVAVAWAMRYGSPSVDEVLNRLRADGVERLCVMPLFAQYAPQTTAACFDAVFDWMKRQRAVPALRTITGYHQHPAYIDALAERIQNYWERHGSVVEAGGKLLMSFHGLPKKGALLHGDRYEAYCRETAQALAERLGLSPGQWALGFQSRFGREEWLQPYTLEKLEALVRDGLDSIDVVCPGFAADCLETIEEIDDELRRAFRAICPDGRFRYIPALNASDAAIDAYETILRETLAGW